ncbi:outer membrane OMP85 family protein [Striga asiatica]|uniref:Outer membrane OMP85 family protein n=1 Tax=Striga asiatica TaxID=4170 RepID=A0A5A7QP22_STRAF|nr:outer membrane OMP85 family protein [Striga asiatica]
MEANSDTDPKLNSKETSSPDPKPYEEIEDGEETEQEEEEEEEKDNDSEAMTPETRMRMDQARMDSLLSRLSTDQVPVRVHDIIIKGNRRTMDSVIEAEVESLFREASSFQNLVRAASVGSERLRSLEIFDSVSITLDAGPPELPGTANIVIEVSEAYPFFGKVGVRSRPEFFTSVSVVCICELIAAWSLEFVVMEFIAIRLVCIRWVLSVASVVTARTWSLEAFGRLKNLFGYGDLWDASLGYAWGQALEVSTGILLPRFKGIPNPLSARISMLSQDWMKFSSYKEQVLGLSLGLLETGRHSLSYNLSWSTLTDPSQMSSHTVRRQLGHNLLSSLKYAFKVDLRDSSLRPTRGHTFLLTTQVGGLLPNAWSQRFIRQEFDLRYAIPLGFYGAALNFGISAGILVPWSRGSLSMSSYLPERFFMGGKTSPVCSFSGPISVLGFKARGLGPAEPRRFVRADSGDESSDYFAVDYIGGDLAMTAFADLSFDLPLKGFRAAGIHGHVFASTGSLNKLSENAYKELSLQKFKDSFRSTVGVGLIVPFKKFRMEVNYCHILKQLGHDHGKSGIQFSFSFPHSSYALLY